MIKKLLNYFLLLFVLIASFSLKAAAQDIQVRAKLDQTTIRIGDQTKLHLSIEQAVNERVDFPVLADSLTGKVLIVSSSKIDTIADESDLKKITVTKSITITGFDAGSYTIPALSFKAGQNVLKTDEVTLTVATVKVDTTKAIFDIKQPLAVSYTFLDWLRDNWPWVIFPLITVLLIAYLIYYLRKRAKNKPVKEVVVPVIPLDKVALSKLKELQDKKLWQQGEVKQYYSELSDVLREYLEKRYVIKTYEKTTEEIFAALKHKDLNEENRNVLYGVLLTADLVKFAKEQPLPVENEQSIENAMDFVVKTKPKPIVIPAKIEGGTASGNA